MYTYIMYTLTIISTQHDNINNHNSSDKHD